MEPFDPALSFSITPATWASMIFVTGAYFPLLIAYAFARHLLEITYIIYRDAIEVGDGSVDIARHRKIDMKQRRMPSC